MNRKPSRLNDYKRWYGKHFTTKEIKAIVAYPGLEIGGVGPEGYSVRIQKENGFCISKNVMTKAELLTLVMS